MLRRSEDFRVGPGRRGKIRVPSGPIDSVRLNPGLHFRQAGKTDLRIPGNRDRFTGFHLAGNGERGGKRLQRTLDIVVALGVGVVGVVEIGEHDRSEEHTSELQSHHDLVCRLLLEKKKKKKKRIILKNKKKIKKRKNK